MKKRELRNKILKTLIVGLLALVFISPLLWMISSSLKKTTEVFASNFSFFGERLRWDNYKVIWSDEAVNMLQAYFNTFKIVVISTIGQLAIASMAGYAFAKIEFKGKNFVFMLFLASMMIPTQVTIIPRFMLFKTMNLYNSHWAIILPTLFNATAIFMLRQFYMGLPTALMEAAKIDGAGHFRIFVQIMMPLTKSALITLMVLSFVSSWNEYLSPLIFLTKEKLYVVSQVIRWYLLDDLRRYELVMAAATSAIVPVVVLFLACQKHFVEGLATSGVKG